MEILLWADLLPVAVYMDIDQAACILASALESEVLWLGQMRVIGAASERNDCCVETEFISSQCFAKRIDRNLVGQVVVRDWRPGVCVSRVRWTEDQLHESGDRSAEPAFLSTVAIRDLTSERCVSQQLANRDDRLVLAGGGCCICDRAHSAELLVRRTMHSQHLVFFLQWQKEDAGLEAGKIRSLQEQQSLGCIVLVSSPDLSEAVVHERIEWYE